MKRQKDGSNVFSKKMIQKKNLVIALLCLLIGGVIFTFIGTKAFKNVTEIHKYNGNVAGVMADTNIAYDIEKLKSQYANMSTEIDNNNTQTDREEYSIK